MTTATKPSKVERLADDLATWRTAGGRTHEAPLGHGTAPVLVYLGRYHRDHEYMPTFADIQRSCNFSTKSLVFRALRQLQMQGYLTYEPGQPRTIRLTPQGKEALHPILMRN